MIYNIVIPLHDSGGKLKNNTELRYAIRSICENFNGKFKLYIVGKNMPSWAKDIEHIPSTKGLKKALTDTAKHLPTGFFWWYDDVTLLHPQTPSQLKITQATKRYASAQGSWARGLEKIRLRLIKEGYQPWDYSRPHGVYWFDQSMVTEGFADWPGMKGKFPWETWILSKRNWPRTHAPYRQIYGKFRHPASTARYLNYNDRGNTPELRAWLQARFPTPSPFEQPRREHLRVPTTAHPLAVYTLRFGNPPWLAELAPRLEHWCHTHHHPLHIWSEPHLHPAHPAPKFCIVEMLRAFLTTDYSWMMYVDADVWVRDSAPPHPDLPADADLLIRQDAPGKGSRSYPAWIAKNFPHSTSGHPVYHNTGIFLCSRKGAAALLKQSAEPFVEGFQEQNQLNLWIHRALTAKEITLYPLSAVWNSWPSEYRPAAFHHLCGGKKEKYLQELRSGGIL